MRRLLRENGLSIVWLGLFFLTLIFGQSLAGHREYNSDQLEHGQRVVSLAQYLGTGHFVEALFENWESEFLQMAMFVVLTAILRQKGSPESKKLQGSEEVDEDPREARDRPGVPWPVRHGGLALRLYEHSLTIALTLLFVASLALHALGGASEYNDEQRAHGGETITALAYMATSRFWFESFQNWQSEFFSVGMLVVLSIYLRQRGSSQSKPVASPHSETGQGGGDGEQPPKQREPVKQTERKRARRAS